MVVPGSPLSLCEFSNDEEGEMPSTVLFGWNPTTVSSFMSKYATVQWDMHGIAPPLGLIYATTKAEEFQRALLGYVAAKIDDVTIEGNEAMVCKHAGVMCRLGYELRRLAEDSWVRTVLDQSPPLLHKIARVYTITYGKSYSLIVGEHVLFN